MRRVFCLLLFATLTMAACDKPEPPLPLQVGDHSITLLFPADWEHINFGDKHQFRHDQERISLEDMGHRGRDLDLAIARAMVILREDGRREEASRDPLIISGRPAMVVDTWDHLSHEYRKRYLFALNDRSLLVVYTMSGQFEKMEPTFTELTGSIAFVDSLEQTGLPDREDHPK
jgi:hypothetical protein